MVPIPERESSILESRYIDPLEREGERKSGACFHSSGTNFVLTETNIVFFPIFKCHGIYSGSRDHSYTPPDELNTKPSAMRPGSNYYILNESRIWTTKSKVSVLPTFCNWDGLEITGSSPTIIPSVSQPFLILVISDSTNSSFKKKKIHDFAFFVSDSLVRLINLVI